MSGNLDELLAQLDAPQETPQASVDEGELAVTEESPLASQDEIKPTIDVHKHVRKFENVSGEILDSWRADREEAQSAVNLLRNMIEDAIAKGGHPTGTWLEAYVGAIKAKADANSTASKLLDTTVKLINLAKPNVKVNNTTTTVNHNSLTAILNDPIRSDDV